MINTNTLNSVLLGLIIAIVILLIVKVTGIAQKDPEYMNTNSSVRENHFDNVRNPVPTCSVSKYCDLNVLEDRDSTLRRDIVIGRKLQQGDKKDEFDDVEIKEYQSQFLDFDNKVNNTSRNELGPIEKLNDMFTSHNNELANLGDGTIGEFFDGLTRTQADNMKKCKNVGCVQESNYDELTHRQYYLDNDATSFTNYQVRYETDNVSNGGFFYDKIEGNDTQNSQNMIWS